MAGANESVDSGATIASWDVTIPDYNTGLRATAAAEMRKIKEVVTYHFPNMSEVCTADGVQLSILDGATLTTAELNSLAGSGMTQAVMARLSGVEASSEDINQLKDNAIVNWTTEIKTSGFTALGGYGYPVDSSGGSFTVILPPATANKVIGIVDLGGACRTNPVTLARLGSDTIEGAGSDLRINVDRAGVVIWCLTTGNWVVK